MPRNKRMKPAPRYKSKMGGGGARLTNRPATKLEKGNRAKPKPTAKGKRRTRRARASTRSNTKSTARVTGSQNTRGVSTAKVRGAQPKVYKGRHKATKEEIRAIDAGLPKAKIHNPFKGRTKTVKKNRGHFG